MNAATPLWPFELRSDESIIRRDAVWVWFAMMHGRTTRTTHLVITTARVLFVPIEGTASRSWLSWLLGSLGFGAPPALRAHEIELSNIRKLWKWIPAFSGPPLIELANGDSWYYELVEDRRPWNSVASKDARREQFEALEEAWETARVRAASQDPQP